MLIDSHTWLSDLVRLLSRDHTQRNGGWAHTVLVVRCDSEQIRCASCHAGDRVSVHCAADSQDVLCFAEALVLDFVPFNRGTAIVFNGKQGPF